jgi:hypothetical protein
MLLDIALYVVISSYSMPQTGRRRSELLPEAAGDFLCVYDDIV